MRRTLGILAVATLAFQLALRVFGGAVERALFAESWPPVLMATTISLASNTLLILTAGAGIYVASRARRGGWIALFGAALVFGLYGPFVAGIAMPYLGVARGGVVYVVVLDILLEVLVPLLALAYTLRFYPARGEPALTQPDRA